MEKRNGRSNALKPFGNGQPPASAAAFAMHEAALATRMILQRFKVGRPRALPDAT